MSIHQFNFEPRKAHSAGQVSEPQPSIPQKLPGHPDLSKDTSITYDPTNLDVSTDIRTILPVGFHAIDEGVKKSFVGLKIPTKDDVRDFSRDHGHYRSQGLMPLKTQQHIVGLEGWWNNGNL